MSHDNPAKSSEPRWGDSRDREARARVETPRTDALLLELNEGRVYKTEGPMTDLARTLERELAQMAAQKEELEALMVGTPTCEHGNYTEADARRIALLAASKAREEERERCAKVCEAQATEPECPERALYCAAAIRRGKP